MGLSPDFQDAAAIAWFMARTPAAAPSGWFQTALTTARKSAPASTSGRAVFGVDTADRDARQFHDVGPPAQEFGLGARRRRLRRGVEEGAERDVVRAVLARRHREVAAGVATDAEREIAEQFARRRRGRVVLPDMRAVAAMRDGEIGPVVEEERDAAALRDGTQHVDRAPQPRRP